jgi:hypothetical protein
MLLLHVLKCHLFIDYFYAYFAFASMNLVVTVDGILLTKSGTMTGGVSGGMEARSNKWDDSRIECSYDPFLRYYQ